MTKTQKPQDYIQPLDMNGLQGRMLSLKSRGNSKNEILFVYGHHSSLERWWGLVQVLSRYGNVTMPDLPGFGGMDSFYKIGRTPTIDAMAEYLASFIKLRYNKKKIKIAGLSFGFVVATRMLQLYPEMSKQVDMLVSVAGFSHEKDFSFNKPTHSFYVAVSRIFKHKIPAIFFKNVLLNPLLIKLLYAKTPNAKHKFKDMDKDTLKEMINFEVYLWHVNDVRTHWHTSEELLTLDNTRTSINMPLHHVAAKNDQYFDSKLTEKHLRVIYADVTIHQATLDKHAPSLIADEQQASHIIPTSLTKILK